MARSLAATLQEFAPFIEGGVAILVGTADADHVPHAVRGWGATVVDGRSLRLLLPDAEASLWANLASTRRVATCFTDVATYRSIQVKGAVTELPSGHRTRTRCCGSVTGSGSSKLWSQGRWSRGRRLCDCFRLPFDRLCCTSRNCSTRLQARPQVERSKPPIDEPLAARDRRMLRGHDPARRRDVFCRRRSQHRAALTDPSDR